MFKKLEYKSEDQKNFHSWLKGKAKEHRVKGWEYEKKFKKLLNQNGFHVNKQKVIRKYIIDLAMPWKNLLIEVDGPYHKFNRAKDQARESTLRNWGFNVIRFTHEDIDLDPIGCLMRIEYYKDLSANKADFQRRVQLLNKGYAVKTKNRRKRKVVKDRIEKAKIIKHKAKVHKCLHGSSAMWCCQCRYKRPAPSRPVMFR